MFVAESLFPRFVEPVPNVTVTVGRDALLACVVEDLRSYKVKVQFLYYFFFTYQIKEKILKVVM